jgi:hypothetical protein
MRRDFGEVGVGMSPARLREISGGAEPTDEEATEIEFALMATDRCLNEQLAAELERRARLGGIRTIVTALVILNLLLVGVWWATGAAYESLILMVTPGARR